MADALSRLRDAARIEERALRTLRTAAVISETLARRGVTAPVLVGGGAVEIYTRSAYTTHDLDFVAVTDEALARTLEDLGFRREGRVWIQEELALVVEFPASVLEPAVAVAMDVDGMELRIISVEDLIVDRLASWKHWGWDPDGAAAALLLALHTDLDRTRLERRAGEEDVADALAALRPPATRSDPISGAELRRLRRRLEK